MIELLFIVALCLLWAILRRLERGVDHRIEIIVTSPDGGQPLPQVEVAPGVVVDLEAERRRREAG